MPCPVALDSYTFVLETKENLDWAELITLDFSKYGTPEGKQDLAQFLILIKALREKGFLYVKNFNISQETVNRQLIIGREFYELPLEEKLKYVPEGLGTIMDPHFDRDPPFDRSPPVTVQKRLKFELSTPRQLAMQMRSRFAG